LKRSGSVTNGTVRASAASAAGTPVNANMLGIVDAISKLRASGEAKSAWNQYFIGELVQKVEDEPAKYGHGSDETAVQYMGKQLKCGKDTLYNAARVSRFWKRSAFGRWLQKKGKNGARLTFAHFTEALRHHDTNVRDEMLERALAENMSSRAVRRAVEATQPKTPKPESKVNLLKKFIGSSQKALTTWQGIDALIGDGGVDDLTLIDKAAELQHQLSELCLENAKALHRALDGRATASPTNTAALPLGMPSPRGSSILGASNSATPAAKLLCASNPAADPEEPEPDPKGPGGAPRPAAPHPDAEVGEDPRAASVERESGALATAGAGPRNTEVDSFGRRLALIGKYVQKQIAADAVEEYEVPPAISGMSRPMTVLLAKRRAELIKCAWHGDKRTFCPPIWGDFAIGSGACGFGCRLCFLMLTFRVMRDPLRPYVYTNIDDYDRSARKWLLAKHWTVKFGENDVERPRTNKDSIGLGIDCADSLLWEGVTGHARNLIPLFTDPATNPLQNPLVLLTKSANTHYLGQLSDRDLRRHDGKVPNTAVTMSLNPEAIADVWEGKYSDTMERITPPIERRLAALRDTQEMGFEVRVRVDPILTPVGWQEQYREFFNAMAHRFGLRPTMITLGSYREKNAQLDHWRAEWKLPAVEWEPEKTLGRDGTHVHDANREVAYVAVRDMISESYKGTGFMPNVSLCKETHEVRKATDLCNANCNCLRAPSTWKSDARSVAGAGVRSTDAGAALPSAAGARP
jgi:DNA repair photolyase